MASKTLNVCSACRIFGFKIHETVVQKSNVTSNEQGLLSG